MSETITPVVEAEVSAAAARIAGHVTRTPVLTSDRLNQMCSADLFFKAENLQVAGAFKARGATNAVASLGRSELERGVATHSSGNHGAALAYAAKRFGVPAHIVVPASGKARKRALIKEFGGTLYDCGDALEDRDARLEEVVAATGATVVHPYDDRRVIAGQGTAALELLEDVPDLETIWVPVGGGGLAAGTVAACAHRGVVVRGAEPELARDAHDSLARGVRLPQLPPLTIADGLRTALGVQNFAMLSAYGSRDRTGDRSRHSGDARGSGGRPRCAD